MNIKVISMFEKQDDPDGIYVNTTSKAKDSWERDLSPFFLGPCFVYDGYLSANFENLWQYAKVYAAFADKDNEPTQEYFTWAKQGWDNSRAVRYPMGKGAKPLYSYWKRQKLGYIDARKQIYAPVYAREVTKMHGFCDLEEVFRTGRAHEWSVSKTAKTLYLRDYDGYDHDSAGMTLTEVLNNPNRKMGHAFVLKMLLLQDPALQQCAQI